LKQSYVSVDGERLGSWVAHQKALKKKGQLGSEQVALLETLPGWTWEKRPALRLYEALLEFQSQHGDGTFPDHHHVTSSGYRLGLAYTNARRRRPAKDAELLESLPGWTWAKTQRLSRAQAFQERYEVLASLSREAGEMQIPRHLRTASGLSIYGWLYHVSKNRRLLSESEISQLEEIPGWVWPGEAKSLIEEFGDTAVELYRQGLSFGSINAKLGIKSTYNWYERGQELLQDETGDLLARARQGDRLIRFARAIEEIDRDRERRTT
jgi:hypothetical protein